LLIATTAPNDAKAQGFAREITERQVAEGSFPVVIAPRHRAPG